MSDRTRRLALGSLLVFLAVNAFAGGWYAMTGAAGVPLEWLEGSAFATYRVPGLILFALVGGSAAIAGVMTLARNRESDDAAKLAGWTLLVWLAAQVTIIGLVSWLQPAMAAVAAAILALAYRRRTRYA